MKKSSNATDAAPRVLVVDDEPDLRDTYELALVREGYQIFAAGSVAEARALMAEQSFDVLITDMQLPAGLGLELLRDIARAQRTERSVVITAHGSMENAVESLKSGAFGIRPVTPLPLPMTAEISPTKKVPWPVSSS